MPYIGGDSLEISYQHPTLGNGTVFPKANETFTYDLGGIRNNDDANGVAGNSEIILIKNRIRAYIEGVIAWDFTTGGDTMEKLNQLAESNVPADWVISGINGSSYKLTGWPVGDIQGDSNASTISLKIAGGGKMVQIA